jgi:hypothetical protein
VNEAEQVDGQEIPLGELLTMPFDGEVTVMVKLAVITNWAQTVTLGV